MLIEIEPLTKMIKLVLQSSYIKDSKKPVSLLILAKPESAKTSAIMEFQHIQGTFTTNAITQQQIVEKILPMIESKNLKHLIIPDILNCLGVAKSTRQGFENMVKSMIEEGITSLDKFFLRTNKVYNPPLRCGLITAITTESYDGYFNPLTQRTEGGLKHEWRKSGLLSRFLPFSYSYSVSKVAKIFRYIHKEDTSLKKKNIERIKRSPVEINGNPELFTQLDHISMDIGKSISGYGIRVTESLQSLVKANAILRTIAEKPKTVHVKQEDVDEILNLGTWINYKFNPL